MYVRAAILRYLAYEWSSGWEDQLLSHILSAHHQAFQAIPDFKVAKDGHDSLTHRGNLTPFPCYTVKYYTHMYTSNTVQKVLYLLGMAVATAPREVAPVRAVWVSM